MSEIATTRLSTKGQVVIPEEVRRRLNLTPGARFVVVGEGDTVVLRLIRAPDLESLEELLAETRSQARRAHLTKRAVADAVREVRGRR